MNAPILERLSAAAVSPTALVLPESWSFEQWSALGPTLCFVDGSVQWWLGDWISFGRRRWGEHYTEALETTGFDHQRLRSAKYVASQFELPRRRNHLSWSHHRAVASLETTDAARLLDEAEREGLSAMAMRSRF
jgi:hypothetical protein